MVTTIEKKYIYKAYNNGSYVGIIPNVISEFNYKQDINTASAQLTIVVNKSADNIDEPVEPLQDEGGFNLTDENNEILYEERRPPIFGNYTDILYAPENEIKVYEVSNQNPNGLLVFNGWVTSIEAGFGNDDLITLTCLSKGCDLSNYLILTGDTTVAQYITPEDSQINGGTWSSAFIQRIEPTSDITIRKIVLKLRSSNGNPHTITPVLVRGDPTTDLLSVLGGVGSYTYGSGNTELASFSSVVVTETSFTEKTFSLDADTLLSGGTSYYILWVMFEGDSTVNFAPEASTVLSTAPITKAYSAIISVNNTSTSPTYPGALFNAASLYIKLLVNDGNTESPYTSQDPTDIFTSIIDNYSGQGGAVLYDGTSTTDTGLSVSYTFKISTALDGIKKCLELAPSDWFWYVDPGSLVAYFKQTSTTADHTFIKKRHINDLNLKITSDHIVNKVYFSGGDSGSGSNLLLTDSNTSSDSSRQRLGLISDNRVTNTTTAETMMSNYLDDRAEYEYETTLVIPASVYDISTINVGDTVGFSGFGVPVDSLILQIVSVSKHPDYIQLQLGMLPIKLTTEQTKARRDLIDLQTLDNPGTPS